MTEAPFSLDAVGDRRRADALDAPPRIDLVAHIRAAGRHGHIGFALGPEMWRLNRGNGKLTPAEYYYYRLYDEKYDAAEKSRFIGKHAQHAMHAACNDPGWFAAAHDKLLFDAILRGNDLPCPKIVALYDTAGRKTAGRCVGDAAALEGYLSDPANFPVFAKPLDGMYSIGVLDMVEYDGANVRLGIDAKFSVSNVVQYISDFGRAGYLFQDRLRPHPDLVAAFGPTLSSVRVLILLGPSGPITKSAVSKIPLARNMADNFWRTGNMLAAVNLESGVLGAAVSGVGEARQAHQDHPETGVRIEGLSLPQWLPTMELCKAAARAFPGIRTQSWDVAITDQGPVLMELNFGGDLNLHQIAHGKGMLDEIYAEHLRRCGYKLKSTV